MFYKISQLIHNILRRKSPFSSRLYEFNILANILVNIYFVKSKDDKNEDIALKVKL